MRPLDPHGLRFEIPIEVDGVVATLMRRGTILGQGISRGGKAIIHLDKPLPNRRRLRVSLSKQGCLHKSWNVSVSKFR